MMMTTMGLVGVGVVWGVRLQQRQRQSEGVLLLVERGTPQARGGWHLLRPILRRRLGHADHDG